MPPIAGEPRIPLHGHGNGGASADPVAGLQAGTGQAIPQGGPVRGARHGILIGLDCSLRVAGGFGDIAKQTVGAGAGGQETGGAPAILPEDGKGLAVLHGRVELLKRSRPRQTPDTGQGNAHE
jgi:hypothetical protein